ncbi:MAG: protein kinase [Pirellulales bacterium]|nr:protein kinase [Pirellulales bacterium]
MSAEDRGISHVSETNQTLVDLFDELAGRLQAGESVDLEHYPREHPECADSLRQLLPTLEAMVELGRSRAADGSSCARPARPATAELEPGVLGDFRILRQIGRGGMGVVYEAEQISLRRRVALKILPFAAVLDPRQLQRFKNEAQAAAVLHHTNIVPVHAVGCDRGVHYYAMQYIEGQTLAQVIAELREFSDSKPKQEPGQKPLSQATRLFIEPADAAPCEPVALGERDLESPLPAGNVAAPHALPEERQSQPIRPPAERRVLDTQRSVHPDVSSTIPTGGRAFFRAVASVGIQAAEAMDHAHQMGVVHRDVKPSNLMIDSHGQLWITDFGLAMTQHDPGLTMTGDLLGTLRYMSPEQMEGNRRILDHHTDVYSLGVTLYELLTLEQPFGNDDRPRVMQQIIEGDYRQPRAIAPSIPKDLETIVLKAMATDAKSRYATAQELADDLRRFVACRPIQAKAPRATDRMAKWMRRHVWSMVVSGVMMLILLIVLAVATVMILMQNSRTEAARKDALLAAAEADQERAAADYSRRQSQILSTNLALNRGLALCGAGELGQGLLWLGRALEVAPADALELRAAIRKNLAGWGRQVVQLQSMLEGPGDADLAKLAFSPNGDAVLAADSEGSVFQAKLPTSGPLAAPSWREVNAAPPYFSSDARLLVTSCAEGILELGDHEEPTTRQRLPYPHKTFPAAAALSPDGRTAMVTTPTCYQLWNMETGKKKAEAGSQGGEILGFTPDGRRVFTAENDRLWLWDAATGQPSGGPIGEDGSATYSVTFDSASRKALIGKVYRAQLWDAATGQPFGRLLRHGSAVRCCDFGPDGARLLTGCDDQTARLWDTASQNPLGQPLLHSGPVLAVRFRPGGRSFLTGAPDSPARLWQVPLGPAGRFRLDHPAVIEVITFSADGKTLLTACRDQSIRLWDAETGKRIGEPIAHPTAVRDAAFRPDGKMFATAGADGRILLWNTASAATIRRCDPLPFPVDALRFAPDGKSLFGVELWHVYCWDAETLACRGSGATAGSSLKAAVFSRDGRMLLTGWDDGTIRRYDATTQQIHIEPMRHAPRTLVSVGFSSDGAQIMTSFKDGTVWLWDVSTGERVGELLRNQREPREVVFSPDGRTCVASYGDGIARFVDLLTGRPLGAPLEHNGPASLMAFSSDGRRLATRDRNIDNVWVQPTPTPMEGEDRRIVLWTQVVTGLELDAAGSIEVLSAKTWQDRRGYLEAFGGSPRL